MDAVADLDWPDQKRRKVSYGKMSSCADAKLILQKSRVVRRYGFYWLEC